jgi:hypothetical protein
MMATKSATEWLTSLDMSGITEHLKEARRQDEEDARCDPELCCGCQTDPFSDDEPDTD